MKSCQISVSCKKSLVVEIIPFEWNAYCWCCCKWLGPTHRADSDPVVVCCDTPRGYGSKWWNIVNCTGHIVFLASLHVGGGVCAGGKLALADISTRSTSGPSSAGRTVVPAPRGIFWGPGAAKINIFFQSLWDWTGIAAAALSSCLSDLEATRSTYMAWSCGSRGPRDLAVGFLAAQLTGALNNQLEYIARNMYIYYFVIEPSSLFCTDVRTCVIISSMYSLYIRWINDFWFWFWFWLWFWLNHLRAVSDMLTFLSEWKIFGSAIGWHDDK